MVEFKGVYYSFTKDYNVLHDVSFQLPQGEKAIIIAEESSGIISLIRLLLKLEKQNAGVIKLKNIPINKISFSKDIFLAYLPSKMLFFNRKTVYNNLKYFLKLHKQDYDSTSILKLCADYSLLPEKMVTELSYIERLYLALARFSIRRVELMIVEDIFENIDDTQIIQVFELITTIINKNKASLILTLSNKSYNKLKNMVDNYTLYNLEFGTLVKVK